MKLLRALFFSALIFFCFFPVMTTAQTSLVVASPSAKPSIEYPLPYPGLLPGHPLYPVKRLRDRILLFFTPDPAKKSTLLLLLADKKLAMVIRLWESQKQELAVQTLEESQEHVLEGSRRLVELQRENTLPVGLAEKYDVASRKHEEIISGLIKTAPPAAIRDRIEYAQTRLDQARQYILSTR